MPILPEIVPPISKTRGFLFAVSNKARTMPGTKEYDDAYQALESVGMLAYANRPIGNLSGGQQQRIFIARALVQESYFSITKINLLSVILIVLLK